jgi:1-acyl-sn-glycerol-3-phosphate acyltransferase
MIHTIYVIIISLLSTFYTSLKVILLVFRSPYSKRANKVIKDWANSLLKVGGIRLEVFGRENIQPDKPYIYLANHQGNYDIMASFSAIPGTSRFVAKKELFGIPVFAQAMRVAGMIEIDRGNSMKAKKTLDNAIHTIHNHNVSIIVFPEGTRSRDGKIHPFKKGGVMLALKGKIDVVPTSISGSFHIMQKDSWKLNKGKVKVVFSKPISVNNFEIKDRNKLIEIVEKQVRENFDPQYK